MTEATGEQARWERVTTIFAEAAELTAAARDAFLARATAGDPELRAAVEELLAASGPAERFFDRFQLQAMPAALAALEDGDPTRRTGRTYGRYQVHDVIGQGGMGVVYRATDTRLGRPAALKFLPRAPLAGEEAHSRLVDEARAASSLDDPNICTIFGVDDTPTGETFIAMALYEGETLAERIARGPMPLGEALPIAVGIARGLAVAHARGIVHRDLNPRNVMLTARDRVKILDFGLAHAAGAGTGAGPAGTPAYLAPEQIEGGEPGTRTDVWSFGVTLYELFTGRKPFAGPDVGTTLDAVLAAAPRPPRELAPDLPEPLERLILAMLARDPAGRPTDGGAVLAVLEPLLQRYRSRRARLAVTGVVTTLAALVVALFLFRGPEAPPPEMPAVRLVLLPIERDSADLTAVYLAASLREFFADHLSRIGGLAVISWPGGGPSDNTPASRKRLGRALHAGAVLQGRVVGMFTVALELRSTGDDRVIWSTRHDFTGRRVNADGRALAIAIAGALAIPRASSRAEVRRPGTFATDPRTGHVYEAVPVTLNWWDAQDAAAARTHQGMTGHLAAIGSREENEFIRLHLREAVAGQYWLGGFRDLGGWAWVTGEPFRFAHWFDGEPNDYFGEDGINYSNKSATGEWNDADRTTGFEGFIKGFLVEYEPPSVK